MLRTIGMSTIPPFFPATLSVSSKILFQTSLKLANFYPFTSSNTAQGWASS